MSRIPSLSQRTRLYFGAFAGARAAAAWVAWRATRAATPAVLGSQRRRQQVWQPPRGRRPVVHAHGARPAAASRCARVGRQHGRWCRAAIRARPRRAAPKEPPLVRRRPLAALRAPPQLSGPAPATSRRACDVGLAERAPRLRARPRRAGSVPAPTRPAASRAARYLARGRFFPHKLPP